MLLWPEQQTCVAVRRSCVSAGTVGLRPYMQRPTANDQRLPLHFLCLHVENLRASEIGVCSADTRHPAKAAYSATFSAR